MKNVLIKLGGSVITDIEYRKNLINQLVDIKHNDYNISVVHGGGKLISYYLSKLDIVTEFYDGLRITSSDVLDVAMMVLAGKVNKDIVKEFDTAGVMAIGLCGGDGNLIKCEKLELDDGPDLGYVGIPRKINVSLYYKLVELGYVLVIATIGIGTDGYYNVNADHTAAFIAGQVRADHLIFVSDIDGVLHPETNEVFVQLNENKIQKLQEQGIIKEGMLPKLNSCLDALKHGVKRVSIINGQTPNSVFDTVVNAGHVGTEIVLE